jgi:hypothetical protein
VLPPLVLVVGETPSLGRAIVDLLDAEGYRTAFTLHLDRVDDGLLRTTRLVIAAANGPYCATLRERRAGAVDGQELIVVGSYDPLVTVGPRVHPVQLPLQTAPFLALVRSLVG